MHLKTLLAGLSLRSATADMETEITRISYDSRTTAPGDVFVAMTGFATDGHAYIGKAVAAGVLHQDIGHGAVLRRLSLIHISEPTRH